MLFFEILLFMLWFGNIGLPFDRRKKIGPTSHSTHTAHCALPIKKKGKIDILVPQLLSEGQVHPSTFNIVPQLLFLGQTYPCAIYIA